MRSVFLSYSQRNIEQALLVERELTSGGLTVWRDQEQFRAGERWSKALGEAIAASDAVLLLSSEDAAWVRTPLESLFTGCRGRTEMQFWPLSIPPLTA